MLASLGVGMFDTAELKTSSLSWLSPFLTVPPLPQPGARLHQGHKLELQSCIAGAWLHRCLYPASGGLHGLIAGNTCFHGLTLSWCLMVLLPPYQTEGVKYINGFGKLVDAHTVLCTDAKGQV